MRINALLREAINRANWCLRFAPVGLQRCVIATFSDASWANAQENQSQAGFLCFLASEECFAARGGPA
eukprot:9078277-Lingulodinium_polyedra.AAC.1